MHGCSATTPRKAGAGLTIKKIVGTVLEFPKRKDAEKAVMQLRVDVYEGAAFAPMNLEQLVAHYQRVELPLKAYSTAGGIQELSRSPRRTAVGEALTFSDQEHRGRELAQKLQEDRRSAGQPGTKTKIRNLMSALFSHAIRHGWACNEPNSCRPYFFQTGSHSRTFSPLRSSRHYCLNSQRERVMVLLDGSTGLRRGELIALRWRDMDFELECRPTSPDSIWHNVLGDTKTEASRKPVPLHPFVHVELNQWKLTRTMYHSDDDYLFPSIRRTDHSRSAGHDSQAPYPRGAERIGVTKKIGWHSFRHGFATMLRQKKST